MSFGKIIYKKNTDLSKRIDKQKVPEHVAIIMDGNGRWATKKGLPRSFGHNKGVSVLKEILKSSHKLGCKILTVYAFSTENWTRPITTPSLLYIKPIGFSMMLKYIKAPLIKPLSPNRTIKPKILITISNCIAAKTKIIRS